MLLARLSKLWNKFFPSLNCLTCSLFEIITKIKTDMRRKTKCNCRTLAIKFNRNLRKRNACYKATIVVRPTHTRPILSFVRYIDTGLAVQTNRLRAQQFHLFGYSRCLDTLQPSFLKISTFYLKIGGKKRDKYFMTMFWKNWFKSKTNKNNKNKDSTYNTENSICYRVVW